MMGRTMGNTQKFVLGALVGSVMLTVAGCEQQTRVPGNTINPGKSVIGGSATGPATAPSLQPDATPSTRSIMQPTVNPEPIVPPPPMPFSATIGFPDGGADIDDAARRTIDGILADPVTATGGAIVLHGSSDSHGSDAQNKAMSRRRAQAVARYLERHGIAKDRVSVIALGEGRPVAPNLNLDGSDNPAGRAKNRRVDVIVSPGTTKQPETPPTARSTPVVSEHPDQPQ